jgi:hypothetical protein
MIVSSKMLISGTNVAAARAGEVVLRRGETLPPSVPGAADINGPAQRFMRVYSAEVFSLLGATALSYSSQTSDQIQLRFSDYDFAKLADGILRDSVFGARLVMADTAGTPYDMTRQAAAWATNPSNLAREIAALPGVSSYRWFGHDSFMFTTDSTASRVKLQQLVDRKLDDRWIGYWKGECFGPKCPPDPAPPTGEI